MLFMCTDVWLLKQSFLWSRFLSPICLIVHTLRFNWTYYQCWPKASSFQLLFYTLRIFVFRLYKRKEKLRFASIVTQQACERSLRDRLCCKYDINMTSVWRLIWLWLLTPTMLHGMVITPAKLNSVRTTLLIFIQIVLLLCKISNHETGRNVIRISRVDR